MRDCGLLDHLLPLIFMIAIFVMSREVGAQEMVEKTTITHIGKVERDSKKLEDLRAGINDAKEQRDAARNPTAQPPGDEHKIVKLPAHVSGPAE